MSAIIVRTYFECDWIIWKKLNYFELIKWAHTDNGIEIERQNVNSVKEVMNSNYFKCSREIKIFIKLKWCYSRDWKSEHFLYVLYALAMTNCTCSVNWIGTFWLYFDGRNSREFLEHIRLCTLYEETSSSVSWHETD